MNQKRQMELIDQLAQICEELNWVIALPTQEEPVPGIIMGQEGFVQEVVQSYYGDAYEVLTKEAHEEGMKEIPQLPEGKKKTTVH